MVILMGVFGHTMLNIGVYFLVSMVIFILGMYLMTKFNQDFTLMSLFALLTWIASMVTLAFVRWPFDAHSDAATIAIVFMGVFLALWIGQVSAWSAKGWKEYSKDRQAKKNAKENAKKAAKNAASLEKLKNLIDL